MTIVLNRSVRIAGSAYRAERQVTLDDAVEADLVARGEARYTLATAAQLGPRLSRRPNTIVIAGDSIQSANVIFTASASAYCARGPVIWALHKLGHPARIVNSCAAGGKSSRQILAQLATGVLPYRPGYCIFNGWFNDPGAGIDQVETVQNLMRFAQVCLESDIMPIYIGIHAATSYSSDARKREMGYINNAMRAFMELAGGRFVDTYSVTLDPSTGGARTNYLYDGTHPSALGAQIIGEGPLYETLLPLLGTGNALAASNDHTNALANPLLLGSNLTGTNGTTLTGWSGTPKGPKGMTADVSNATGSTVADPAARTDGRAGNVYAMTITPSAAHGFGRVYQSVRWGVTYTTGTYNMGSCRVPTVPNGLFYMAVAGGGATGASEPTWPTSVGDTVVDGAVTWRAYRIPQEGEIWQAEFEFIGCAVNSGNGGLPVPIVTVQDGVGSTLQTAYANYFENGSEPYPLTLHSRYVMRTPPFAIISGALWMSPQLKAQGANGASLTVGACNMRLARVD